MFALVRKSESTQVFNTVKNKLSEVGIKAELKLLEPELIGVQLESKVQYNPSYT